VALHQEPGQPRQAAAPIIHLQTFLYATDYDRSVRILDQVWMPARLRLPTGIRPIRIASQSLISETEIVGTCPNMAIQPYTALYSSIKGNARFCCDWHNFGSHTVMSVDGLRIGTSTVWPSPVTDLYRAI